MGACNSSHNKQRTTKANIPPSQSQTNINSQNEINQKTEKNNVEKPKEIQMEFKDLNNNQNIQNSNQNVNEGHNGVLKSNNQNNNQLAQNNLFNNALINNNDNTKDNSNNVFLNNNNNNNNLINENEERKKEEEEKYNILTNVKIESMNKIKENNSMEPIKENNEFSKNLETQNNLYLICPDCKNSIPYLIKIYEDKKENEIKVTYKCICKNEEKDEILNKMISEIQPKNLCTLHNKNLDLLCSSCKYYICDECYSETHNEHIIKKTDNISNKDIDNYINVLNLKKTIFENDCETKQKELESKINEQIKKLNELKQNYKKCFTEEKNKKSKILSMIKTILEEIKESNKEPSTSEINITKINQIKTFELEEDIKDEKLKTNIEEIIENIKNKEIPLTINYDFSFKNIEKKKQYKNIKTLTGHKEKIVTLIKLSSNYLASGSYDQTIKIWDLELNECIKTIEEKGYVFSLLEFNPNFLLVGTSENNINLYDLNSNNSNSIYTFTGHLLWVNCLVKCNENTFASGSNDSFIKIWNYNNKKCLITLKGHSDCILSLILLKNNNLCSGSADLTIKIWDWNNNILLFTLTGHTKWVKCLFELDNNIIISGSDDKSIKLWKDNICIKTLLGHSHSVRTLCQINDEKFASGSFDNSIKIWDIKSGECEQTLEGHSSNVITVIMLENEILASCSNDLTIKIWG